ncbi:MAG: sigma-70 family RNA polymerase sigma factor [Prevotella sp.]|nr:sigma-70 family RNA polymerase sigma factor [Prevotella sp.]
MIVKVIVSGYEKECKEKFDLNKEKRGLLSVSELLFNKVVEGERENVIRRLMGKFKGLSYEDLEEIYNDGCLVLWEKMMDKDFKLMEKSMVGYLVRICRNIGMHYLRKVNEDVVSFNSIMERGYVKEMNKERGLEEMFELLDEKEEEDEIYERLDMAWGKLKDVDRIILESYYVDGCRMEEIARRVGYRNGNSVKSKKSKVLRKMMEMMKMMGNYKNQPIAA